MKTFWQKKQTVQDIKTNSVLDFKPPLLNIPSAPATSLPRSGRPTSLIQLQHLAQLTAVFPLCLKTPSWT